jgi:chaperonin GroES
MIEETEGKTVNPSGHRLLVKKDDVEEVTKGGIIIPETARDTRKFQGNSGTVVAIGPYCWPEQEPWAEVGDRVIYVRNAGVAVKQNRQPHVILNDEDIIAVLT